MHLSLKSTKANLDAQILYNFKGLWVLWTRLVLPSSILILCYHFVVHLKSLKLGRNNWYAILFILSHLPIWFYGFTPKAIRFYKYIIIPIIYLNFKCFTRNSFCDSLFDINSSDGDMIWMVVCIFIQLILIYRYD